MMHEEVAKYRKLSGDTNPNTSISRIGGYLDGYEKAMEYIDKINNLTVFYTTKDKGINLISQRAVNRIFDKYKKGII